MAQTNSVLVRLTPTNSVLVRLIPTNSVLVRLSVGLSFASVFWELLLKQSMEGLSEVKILCVLRRNPDEGSAWLQRKARMRLEE